MGYTGRTRQYLAINRGHSPISAGFTLFELIASLSIVAILGSLVGPTFLDTVDRNRQQSSLSSVFRMLGAARSEAVNRQATVVACASTDQATCSGTAWESGWIVFVDDGAGGGTADDGSRHADEDLVRIGQPAGGTVTVRTRNFATAGTLRFGDVGFSEERGTIVVCNGDASRASAIVLNLSGQARLAVDENDNGSLNDDQGGDISSCT